MTWKSEPISRLGRKLWKLIAIPGRNCYVTDTILTDSDEVIIAKARAQLRAARKLTRILREFLHDR